ncbi:DUF721 domain-containing protein [Streptomyces sp. ST2-7A]|uniref:DUF721 domain-containing protein n=1 Tax=Streptomyces sp. ST2-7A TaxID=2907214 RepID=UPI0035AB8B37
MSRSGRDAAGAGGGPAGPAEGPDRPAPAEPTGVDLARVALRAARQRARERGVPDRQGRVRRAGVRSGARPGGRDPLLLGAALDRLTSERGWEMPLAVGGVWGRWPDVVGPEIGRHCLPERYDEEERVLTVRCDSTAWATQLRLLAPQLVAKLNAAAGQGSVRLLRVLGPGGPPRGRTGALRAPGSRGPGDTYG